MDPLQLQMMQQMGMGHIPGIPGMAPLTGGGTDMLSITASQYANSPIAGLTHPDISPLAPLGLHNYGMLGTFAGIFGNAYLTPAMQKQGMLPIGNAGSYMQAYNEQQFQKMQQQVGSAVANQDAEGFYRTIRGMAAMQGTPFNRQQREQARSLASSMAQWSPQLAMAMPGMMDAIAGERGSVQAMAAQMMEANRYRMDPTTGLMGYGTEANSDMVNQMFETMFAGDNVSRMQGLRAGDIGQLYRYMSPRGLVSPRGSLRGRTLEALSQARGAGELDAISEASGVSVDGNLAALSNADLQKMRDTGPLRERLTKSDTQQMTNKLQDYVGTLAAMREMFGEAGNPNAPIPLLIKSLEALTGGGMQQFSPEKLQVMVRDMQSLSQMSGKSVDQILQMNQSAIADGQALGIGRYFAPTATNRGIAAGMVYQEYGGSTGFGAVTREEVEQTASRMYSRAASSQLTNAAAALARVEEAGGFTKVEGKIDTPEEIAGERLRRIMSGFRNQQTTYVDPGTGKSVPMPTTEQQIREAAIGGLVGMDQSDFGNLLNDFNANTRKASEAEWLVKGVAAQQPTDISNQMRRAIFERIYEQKPITGAIKDSERRSVVAGAMSASVLTALQNMDPQDQLDTKLVNQTIQNALTIEAGNQGIQLKEAEAMNMAPGVFGAFSNVATSRYGSTDAYMQQNSPRIVEARNLRLFQSKVRSQVNASLSGLGTPGDNMQRLFTALQRQGDRGQDAGLKMLLMDMFGADLGKAQESLLPKFQAISEYEREIMKLSAEAEGAKPERRMEIQQEIDKKNEILKTHVNTLRDFGQSEFGLGGGDQIFNADDIRGADQATRNLSHFNRSDQVRLLASHGKVSDSELKAAADSKLTRSDARALAAVQRKRELAAIDKLSSEDTLTEDEQVLYDQIKTESGERAALAAVKLRRRNNAKSVDAFIESDYIGMELSKLSPAQQRKVIQERRANQQIVPVASAITARMKTLKAMEIKGDEHTLKQMAEDQLIAENQLRSLGMLGKDQSILQNGSDILDFASMSPELRQRLAKTGIPGRADVISGFLDQEITAQFLGADAGANRQRALEQLETSEGKKSIKDTGINLEAMFDLRRKFLMDEKAIGRLGSATSLEAVQRSQQAQNNLQSMADTYFDGNLEKMVTSRGLAMSEAGQAAAKTRFESLSESEKKVVAARLTKAGTKATAGDLTQSHYNAYLSLSAQDSMKQLTEANQMLEGARKDDPAARNKRERARYTAARNTLLKTMSADEVDKKLGTFEQWEQRAASGLEELSELDLRPVDALLAEQAGVDASPDSEEFKEFRKTISSDDDDANDYRTKSMLTGILKQVSGFDISGATSIEKLDTLTDKYASASPEERREMAHKFKLRDSELEGMMRRTKFLNMEGIEGNFTSEHLGVAFDSVRGVDIAKEVTDSENREMRIRGKLEVTGAINGDATMEATTATSGR